MDRLYVHICALTFGVTLATTACSDTVEADMDDEPREAACARPISRGHWEDGRRRTIGADRHVCLCMTEEEYESRSRLDELNQMLLEDCELDALQYDFDWTDCEKDFLVKTWIGENGDQVTWPTGPVLNPPGSAVVCD
jgi:hypothetical protein